MSSYQNDIYHLLIIQSLIHTTQPFVWQVEFWLWAQLDETNVMKSYYWSKICHHHTYWKATIGAKFVVITCNEKLLLKQNLSSSRRTGALLLAWQHTASARMKMNILIQSSSMSQLSPSWAFPELNRHGVLCGRGTSIGGKKKMLISVFFFFPFFFFFFWDGPIKMADCPQKTELGRWPI